LPPTFRTREFSALPGVLLNRTMTFIFWLLRDWRYSRRTLALILRSRRSDAFPLSLLALLASLLAAHPSATATATATTLTRPRPLVVMIIPGFGRPSIATLVPPGETVPSLR
jgi:hypothetical protein